MKITSSAKRFCKELISMGWKPDGEVRDSGNNMRLFCKKNNGKWETQSVNLYCDYDSSLIFNL